VCELHGQFLAREATLSPPNPDHRTDIDIGTPLIPADVSTFENRQESGRPDLSDQELAELQSFVGATPDSRGDPPFCAPDRKGSAADEAPAV
jgi:hypothetical protein